MSDLGADPEKWAAAFCQQVAYKSYDPRLPFAPEFVVKWFRDAMDAALKARDEHDRTAHLKDGKIAIRGVGWVEWEP